MTRSCPRCGAHYQGIDVLWYPSFTTTQESDATILSYLTDIPVRAAAIKADIAQYAPGTFWMIGETNSSNQATLTPDKPLGAVFAAGDALSWLAQGARPSTGGSKPTRRTAAAPTNPTYSMFNTEGNPQTPYWGWLLASKLAQPGALLSVDTANTSANVLAFASTLARRQAGRSVYQHQHDSERDGDLRDWLEPGTAHRMAVQQPGSHHHQAGNRGSSIRDGATRISDRTGKIGHNQRLLRPWPAPPARASARAVSAGRGQGRGGIRSGPGSRGRWW